MGDGTKYLEGNYTASNPFTAIKEYAEDLKQAKDLDNAETYMEVWMQHLKDMRNEQHYLVDGSVLTCTRCTAEPQTPLKKSFTAPEGSKEVFLKVTQNTTAKNGAGQCFATLKDSKKFENIAPFGNCLNPPDRDKEKKAIELAEESEELRKLGTCRYLMKLSDEWENLISDTGYQKVTGQGGSLVETITMESVLFCKHGGFVYPIDPGYIMTTLDFPHPEEKWSDTVQSVADWYLDNISTYCHMTEQEIKANGGPSTARGRKGYGCDMSGKLNGLTVYDDCSGFVWACLVQAGYFESSTKIYTSGSYLPGGKADIQMQEAGFSWHPSSELKAEELQKGDILVKRGHVEIFSYFGDDDKEWAWTWGNVYKKEPTSKFSTKNKILSEYEGVWRIGDAEGVD